MKPSATQHLLRSGETNPGPMALSAIRRQGSRRLPPWVPAWRALIVISGLTLLLAGLLGLMM